MALTPFTHIDFPQKVKKLLTNGFLHHAPHGILYLIGCVLNFGEIHQHIRFHGGGTTLRSKGQSKNTNKTTTMFKSIMAHVYNLHYWKR